MSFAGYSCSSDRGPSLPTSGRKFAQRIDAPGIDNFARVAPGLYRGAQPDATGFKHLRSQRFKTVINLRSHHSQKEDVEALGMAAVEIPLQGDIFGSSPPTEDELKLFFDVVLDSARQPAFVHCAHGKDRTGTMVALYRMEIEGWSAEEAIEEMQAFGYHDIYKDLISFVRAYKLRGFRK